MHPLRLDEARQTAFHVRRVDGFGIIESDAFMPVRRLLRRRLRYGLKRFLKSTRYDRRTELVPPVFVISKEYEKEVEKYWGIRYFTSNEKNAAKAQRHQGKLTFFLAYLFVFL